VSPFMHLRKKPAYLNAASTGRFVRSKRWCERSDKGGFRKIA
jgi:hypothetical protein